MAGRKSVGVQTKANLEHAAQVDLQHSPLEDVISTNEVRRFRDLGLGRGVDATNPNMWANKSPFIVRNICSKFSNVIGTEEGGNKQYYSEVVSSLTHHQLNIKLALNEPSSHIRVGIDAENSRSKSTTRNTVGAKVHTRTVSFRSNFKDLPIYSHKSEFSKQQRARDRDSESSLESFEFQLASWILDRVHAEGRFQDKSDSTVVPDDPKSANASNSAELKADPPVVQLASYLDSLEQCSDELKLIATYCKDFVKELGITHYVSAIELGAMKYQVFTAQEYQNKFGAGATLGVEHCAQATVSGKYQKLRIHRATKLREIGKITEGRDVKRNSSEEAVIGFHIQPIHKLVQLHYIQVALQNAVKEYVEKKSDKSEGPFLVSTMVGGEHVYWTVNQQHQLVGTSAVQRASPFYVLPTEHTKPSEFFVSYYGEDTNARNLPVNLHNPMVKFSKQAPLPRYLKSKSDIFGFSDQPLELTSSAKEEYTRFALFNRIVHPRFMCFSTPVSPSCWTEGEEYFINCSRRIFQIDGYLAMKKREPNKTKAEIETSDTDSELESPPICDPSTCTSTYVSVVLPIVPSSYEENLHVGMLFRLHPTEHREMRTIQDSEPQPHGPPPPVREEESELGIERTVDESAIGSTAHKTKYALPDLSSHYDRQYQQIFGSSP